VDEPGSSIRQPWYGYAAFVLGMLHALISVYWVAGGTAGLDTVGGQIEELARARSPVLIAGVRMAAGLKVIAALLGLAVVRPWGQRAPWWMVVAAAWAATTILVTYGGVLVIVEAIVQIGLIHTQSAARLVTPLGSRVPRRWRCSSSTRHQPPDPSTTRVPRPSVGSPNACAWRSPRRTSWPRKSGYAPSSPLHR
jgi:hypothetical protein